MILRIAGLALVVMSGYLFRTADRTLQRMLVAVAFAMAFLGYAVFLLASPIPSVERAASEASWSGIAAAVGIAETSVLWLPTLFVPWSSLRVRFALCAFIVGSAVQAAILFYRPFDIVIINGSVPESAPYLLNMAFCSPFALIGYLVGNLVARPRPVA